MRSLLAFCVAALCGCATAIPSPLEPQRHGTLGTPSYGLLVGTPELTAVPGTFEFLRDNHRRYAMPRFGAAMVRAAERVAREIPGTPPLVVGDFSTERGGQTAPHFSHRNGLDVDLLFYVTTLDGAPLRTREFVHFQADGLGYSPAQGRWLRLDVRRQWHLLRALLQDPEARVQWVFFNHHLEHLLLDWAIAHGEPEQLVMHAAQVLLEPRPGGAHDDHFHVRTYCSYAEVVAGCMRTGPERPWIAKDLPPAFPSDEQLALELGSEPGTVSDLGAQAR